MVTSWYHAAQKSKEFTQNKISMLSFHLIAEINFVDVRGLYVGILFCCWSLIGRSILDILHISCKK